MTPSQDHRYPVIVIGAGLAGLTAAVHLAEGGLAPLIIDADTTWAGGRLAGGDHDTFTYQGREWSFQPEHGVHAVWGNYVNLRAVLDRFTDTILQPSFGEEWINRWGKDVRAIEAGNAIRSRWIPAPFHYLQLLFKPSIWSAIIPLDFLSLPGFLASVLLTVGLDPIAEKRSLDGLTLKEYFRGWTPNLKATFTGVGTNLLAASADEIDLAAFIAAMRFYTMLRRDSWAMAYFPENAHLAVIQPLIEAIHQRGGELKQGLIAESLTPDENGWRISVYVAGQGRRTLYADSVILATHAPGAQRLLHNSPALAEHAKTMTFPRGLRNAVIRLWFSKEARMGTAGGMFTGDFVPDNFFWLHRLYSDCRAWHDETGGSVIEVHVYGPKSILDQPDNALMITVIADVQRAFPSLKGTFVHGVVRRNSGVHTRWRVPSVDTLHVKSPWERLWACGDWIGYDTPALWMERATITGMAAANGVLEHNGLKPFEILQPPKPERFVRGLQATIYGGRRVFGPLWGWRGRKKQS
jgi:carotenoid phi-ring synthase / carotenoid chi-ring synthase